MSDIKFDFIIRKKEKSVAEFNIKLENGSILKVKVYDNLADYVYRYDLKNVFVYGTLVDNVLIAKVIRNIE